MRVTSVTGPWGIAFTALVLAGVLSLGAGCRQPAPPVHGWVKIDALTALHPNQRMIADIDVRLQGLTSQRAQILAQPAFTPSPAVIEQPTPLLPALKSPTATRTPKIPTEELNTEDLKALWRSLTQEMERQYTRKEREERAKYAEGMGEKLAALAQSAEAQRGKVDRQFRQPLISDEMRYTTAKARETPAINIWKTAERGAEAAKSTALNRPNDTAALARAQQESEREKRAKDHLAAVQQEIKTLKEQWESDRQRYTDAIAGINTRFAKEKAAVEEAGAHELEMRLDALWQQMLDDIEQRIAGEAMRLSAETPRQTPPAANRQLTFSEVPAGALRVQAPELTRAYAAANERAQQSQDAAVRAIDDSVRALRERRQALTGEIEQDTRAAANSVARLHGYQLTPTNVQAVDITNNVRQWLSEYWQESPKKSGSTNRSK
ncbi:MAG: hypothetical protein ACYDBB_11115 [Armatimonadota bacterium]